MIPSTETHAKRLGYEGGWEGSRTLKNGRPHEGRRGKGGASQSRDDASFFMAAQTLSCQEEGQFWLPEHLPRHICILLSSWGARN
eukprot:165749-Chlamydomonas_euryale.AAC.1